MVYEDRRLLSNATYKLQNVLNFTKQQKKYFTQQCVIVLCRIKKKIYYFNQRVNVVDFAITFDFQWKFCLWYFYSQTTIDRQLKFAI